MKNKPILKGDARQKLRSNQTQRNDYVPGFVYIVYSRKYKCYKIGLTRYMTERYNQLSEIYESLDFIICVETNNMRQLELAMHRRYAKQRRYLDPSLNGFTEWFKFNLIKIIEVKLVLKIMCKWFDFLDFWDRL
ncbi:MAG: GIY-YIG nuclease family protein [Oscillatoriales cyanobacterium]|uniref:GIY-YIG nuclease family protein n=1 Tax=unclassified Microcoleus TaxID=2642155 RepID=UPI001D6C33B5|nr:MULTISPECIES: GIY-YIG nuclease family protein [unclassified Microcoleus]TAF00841.1 MAG: GIY-YIG nuclease family protein [Oscillatoriales cyanobacterium]MCC3459821.1 GIY-YIG nuclease family protein [Microcoleus sp. PH2017_11_PCY_U_A]MCC3478254.1 GIY-YIG nuclease family protein [Microcoleus sp. PH2017_12_PCY_D_A]TAF21400.1 MAG: GIY-YIG nuclease family protein [Oscillatoriales cyanobacterium]TAF39673.1 MAG: GIY-YIG nuclease family protein [Oscillatoriales cyanobacterium]